MVAFTSKIISKNNKTTILGKDQYFIAKNLADCKKNTVARLYIAKYDRNEKLLSEDRYSYDNLKFRIASVDNISGDIQKYVCKSIK